MYNLHQLPLISDPDVVPGDWLPSHSTIVDQYEEIRGVINIHASLTKKVTLRDGTPWMNPAVLDFRRKVRKVERIWRNEGYLREHRSIYPVLNSDTHCSYKVLRVPFSALLFLTAVVTKRVYTGSSTPGWFEQSSVVFQVIRVPQVSPIKRRWVI